MIDKRALLSRLIIEEGLRLKSYTDSVGKVTIGIGRNISDRGISEDESIYLCNNDINMVISQLQTNLPYYDSLPDNVQLVLADMCFNCGIGELLQFHNTLNLIKIGDYVGASKEMLNSQWARQVGTRALNLSDLLKS